MSSSSPFERVYDDQQIQVWHGDCADVVSHLIRKEVHVDAVLTDCPYDEQTHANARTNAQPGPFLDFPPMAFNKLCEHLELFRQLQPKWLVFTTALSQAVQLQTHYSDDPNVPDGLRFVRTGCFVKAGAMPQLSGDRPAMGWEAVAHMYAQPGRMRWYGGGRSGVYQHAAVGGLHPTQKPDGLAHQWLERFTKEGDLVLDPYAGSGWMAKACQRMGRRCITVEIDKRYISDHRRRFGSAWVAIRSVGAWTRERSPKSVMERAVSGRASCHIRSSGSGCLGVRGCIERRRSTYLGDRHDRVARRL